MFIEIQIVKFMENYIPQHYLLVWGVRLCPCSTVNVYPALLGLVLQVGYVVRTSFRV